MVVLDDVASGAGAESTGDFTWAAIPVVNTTRHTRASTLREGLLRPPPATFPAPFLSLTKVILPMSVQLSVQRRQGQGTECIPSIGVLSQGLHTPEAPPLPGSAWGSGGAWWVLDWPVAQGWDAPSCPDVEGTCDAVACPSVAPLYRSTSGSFLNLRYSAGERFVEAHPGSPPGSVVASRNS